MGNVINSPSESDASIVDQKDREYIELPCSSVFNDEYVTNVYKSLPNLDGEEDDTKSKSSDTADIDANLQRVISILSSQSAKMESTELSSYQKLRIEKDFTKSPFAESSKQRARLLLRIHQAYLRQAKAAEPSGAATAASSDNAKANKLFRSQTAAGQVSKDEDPNAVLVAMNASMCLSIAKTVGRNYPELAINLSNSLVDILKALGPSSLVKEGRNTSALLRNTVSSVFQYASDLEASSNGELRSVALGLMLVVASSVGSVEYIVATINALARGDETLSTSVLSIFEDLNAMKPDLGLITPNAKTVEAKWKASGDSSKISPNLPLRSSSIASDGFSLFVWDETAAALKKIGTGNSGTIQGEELLANSDVSSQIKALLGETITEDVEQTVPESAETEEENVAVNAGDSGPEIPIPVLTTSHGPSIAIDDDNFGCHVNMSGPESVFLDVTYGSNEETTGNYFEIEVISSGPTSQDAVGLGLCNIGVFRPSGEFPGWHAGSYGYHGDNGQLYGANSSGAVYNQFSSGSVVGCGFIASTQSIFFTLNGSLLGTGFTGVAESTLTPVVTFQGTNNRIRINPGNQPFRYTGPEVVYGRFASAAKSAAAKRPTGSHASIAYANKKLYLRSHRLIGQDKIAVVSAKSLRVENILPISSQVQSFIEITDRPLQEYSYSFEHTEVVDLRAAAGYSLNVISANFHEADCSEAIRNLISPDGTVLHFNEMVNILGDPAPGMPKQLTLRVEALPTTLVNGDTDSRAVNVQDSYFENCASEGRYLTILNMATVRNDSTRQALYSCVRDIELMSAYYFDTNHGGSSVLQAVKDKFEAYLSSQHTGSSSPVKVSNEWLSDPQVGTPKTLWINYRVGTSTTQHVLATAEGEEICWQAITNKANETFSGYKTSLQAVIVDPLNELRVHRRVVLPVPACMYSNSVSLLNETSITTNGQKLLIHQIQNGGRGPMKRRFRVFKFDISKDEAALLEETVEDYEKSEFFPSAFTYDSVRNGIWSWDFSSRQVARWRNVGLRPRIGDASANPSLLSASPALRLKTLWADGHASTLAGQSSLAQAAVLSGLLDKIAEAYGPGLAGSASDEIDPISEIELVSKCYQNNIAGYSSIKVRGKVIGPGANPDSGNGRSYNFVTLSNSFNVEDVKNFDTAGNSVEADKMSDYVAGLPNGKLVLVAVNYSSVSNMNPRSFSALRSLGVDVTGLERALSSSLMYDAFAFIGRKGSKPGTAIQKTAPQGSVVKIRQRIPSQPIPLKVESSGSNLAGLTKSVLKFHDKWVATHSDLDASMLISFLHLLTVNTYQLLQGVSEEEALVIFDSVDRSQLKDLLVAIIDRENQDEASEAISRAALHLFVEAINLLYPTSALRQGLLQNYLTQYNNNQLSIQEKKVLELLLTRITAPNELAIIVSGDDTSSITSLLTTLMSILRTELPKRLRNIIATKTDKSVTSFNDPGSLGEASVGLISSLSKMLLSRAAQEIILASETQSLEGEIRGKRGGFTLITMVATMVSTCCDILTETINANKAIYQDERTNMDADVDELLKSTLVGTLVPFFLSSTSLVLSSHGTKLLQWVDTALFSDLHAGLSNFSKLLQQLVSTLPDDLLFSSSATRLTKIEQVYESEHPYANSLDTMTEINIPGASKLTIIFDATSRTENNCDYVRFLDDSGNVLHPGFSFFTGRDGSQNWPGCEGRPPLELEVDSCKMHFHSDGSVNDWGYKFTVSAELPMALSKNEHWLVGLSKQLIRCKTALATTYINSIPWNEPLEDPLTGWMCDPLIQPEMFNGNVGKSEEDVLLNELVDRPEGSFAEALAKIMKKRVREDQGSNDLVNKAVYATCAAIIKHNNLAHEALAVAKKSRTDISPQLIKAWASGQKMRSYFDLADLRLAQGSEGSSSGGAGLPGSASRSESASGPSLYSGADSEVLEAATQAVVERAQFLLRSTAEEDVEAELTPSAPKQKMSSNSLTRTPSYLAKQRWGLLAKTEGLKRQSSLEQHKRGSWGALVSDLVVSEKVKNILAYRRKAAGRKNSKQSTTEKILSFVQSRVNIHQLEQLNILRSKRAGFRANGISLLAASLDANDLPFSLAWILYAFADALRRTAQNETSASFATSRVHYGVVIEGSSQKAQDSLAASFGSFLERALAVLDKASKSFVSEDISEAERISWKSTILACLRALAIDYQEQDHPFLDRTGLLGYLTELSNYPDEDIREVAQTLFEVLVTRCIGSSSRSLAPSGGAPSEATDGHEPSLFSLKIVDIIADRVKVLADSTEENDTSVTVGESTPSGASGSPISIISGVCNLRSSHISPGYSFPHVPVGLHHSFSLWIRRPKCANIDGAEIKIGSKVIRGPDWKSDNNEDGGLGVIGNVVSVDGAVAKVAWPNSKSGNYKFGTQENGAIVNQISLADEAVRGVIFSKGAPSLFEDVELRKACPQWALFGLDMLPDGTVRYFMSDGSKNRFTFNRSKTVTSPDSWTHVTIVQQREKNLLFINGSLDSEIVLDDIMVVAGAGGGKQIVESVHPYLDNTDSYETFTFPGATKLVITFDEQTRTEASYDYLRFYKGDAHTEMWGSDFSGGRNGSTRTFPGLDGRPPLVIPACSFVLYFRSDGSNNDWGYKFTIEAEGCNPDLAFSEKNLNNSPFFIGNGPIYSTSYPSATADVADLCVYTSALSVSDVVSRYQTLNAPVARISLFDDNAALAILSQLLKGINAVRKQATISQSLERTLTSPKVLKSLLSVVINGSPVMQSTAFRVLAVMVPRMEVDIVNNVASMVINRGLQSYASFIHFLFHLIGSSLHSSTLEIQSMALRANHEFSYAVAIDAINLLLSLSVSSQQSSDGQSTGNAEWPEAVATVFIEYTNRTLETISRLSELKESTTGESMLPDTHIAVGLLAFVGGAIPGIFPGAQCVYLDEKGLSEACTVIHPTACPTFDPKKDKDLAKLWGDVEQYGEAVVIVLNSQPDVPITVRRDSLSIGSQGSSTEFTSLVNGLFVHHEAAKQSLLSLYQAIAGLDTTDSRPILQPIKEKKKVELVFESTHPYADCLDEYTDINIPGATSMTITFDSRSMTEQGCDYVRFYKDSRHVDYWGEQGYSGRNGSENFPGTNNNAPLEIPSGSAVLYFHSDGSGNDWGYHFTVKADAISTISPPEPAVLPQLLLLRYIKMMGMRSLAIAAGSGEDWMARSILQFAPAIVQSSLFPLPKSSRSNAAAKPLIIESKHPYDNNMDEYTPVKIKGAKRLSVSFDPMSATENGCDYVRFYTDSTRSTTVPGAETLTGGKDGGQSNWPGIQDRPPLIVEGDSFEIYFHSDGSVNAWGYKIFITPIGRGAENENSEAPPPTLCRSPDDAALQYYYLWELSRDRPGKMFPESTISAIDPRFESKPARKFCHSYVTFGDDLANGSESKATDIEPALTVDVSKDFRVNTRRTWPKGFVVADGYSGDVSVFASADPDSENYLTITDKSKQFLALEASGDWLRVKVLELDGTPTSRQTPGTESSPADGEESPSEVNTTDCEGWVRLRSGDEEYLDGSDFVPGCAPELVVIPDLTSGRLSSSSSSSGASAASGTSSDVPTIHPMYEIDDKSTKLADSANTKGMDALEVMRSAQKRLLWSLTDSASESSIGYSHAALSRLFANWPADVPIATDIFGGLSNLLTYMLITYDSEEKIYTDALSNLKSLLLLTLRSSNVSSTDLCKNLIAFAKSQLQSSNVISRNAPVSRGLKQVIETRHPYEDNTNKDYPVKMSGSKYLLLVFDEKSATETNCDFVTVTDSNGNECGGKIHGRVDGTDKNWPGVNAPALRINGDSCNINFRSDGGVVDWGFKVTVYGVVEEASTEEIEAYEKTILAQSNSSQHPDFACWLLNVLSREHSPSLDKLLFSADTLKSVGDYFGRVDDQKRTTALQLLSNILQSIQKLPVITSEVLTEVQHIRERVLEVASALYKTDTNNGADTQKVSKLLQLSVQVVIVIDALLTLSGSSVQSKSGSNNPGTALPPDVVALDGTDNTNLHSLDQKGLLRWLPEGLAENLETANARRILRRKPVGGAVDDLADTYSSALAKYGFESGVHSWNIKVSEYRNGEPVIGVAMLPVSPSLQIGTSDLQNDVGWGNQLLYVRGFSPVSFGPQIRPGDVVSVKIDVGKGTVQFYRNNALVGLAVGPSGSGAAIETRIGAGPFYPAVSLRNIGDAVEFVEYPLLDASINGKGTSTVSESSLSVPEWMKPLKEVVSTLRSCLLHEVPSGILNTRFLPTCMRAATLVVDLSDDSWQNGVREIEVPDAQSLCIFFENTQLGDNDVLQLIDSTGISVYEKQGLVQNDLPSDMVVSALRAFGSAAIPAANSKKSSIAVGSVVVRGPDWSWGDQDGGVGCLGTVTAIQDWKGASNSGIQVKWNISGHDGLYRWDYSGIFDLAIFSSSATSEGSTDGDSVVVPGCKVVFKLDSNSPGNRLRAHIVPKLTLQAALANPAFEPLLRFLRAQYIGDGTLQSDFAMVRHVDSRAKTMDLNISALLVSKWDTFRPSAEELTRSSALKSLVDSPLAVYPDGFEEQAIPATKSFTGDNESSDPASLTYFVVKVRTNARLTYQESAAFAARIGGRLPSNEELGRTVYFARGNLPFPVYWPSGDEENTWAEITSDSMDLNTPEWASGNEENEGRRWLAVKMPQCAGGRECEQCSEPCILSDFDGDGYEEGFSCNTCRRNDNGMRWLCIQCNGDYCFNCNPIKLNATVQMETANYSSPLVSQPFTCCSLSVTRPDADTDFESLEDAITCNQFLMPPCKGIVFNPSDGKYYLRDGDLIPIVDGSVTFLWRNVDPDAPPPAIASESVRAPRPVVSRGPKDRGTSVKRVTAIPFDFSSASGEDSVRSLCEAMQGEWVNSHDGITEQVLLATPSNISWNFFEPGDVVSAISEAYYCTVLGAQLTSGFGDSMLKLFISASGDGSMGPVVDPMSATVQIGDLKYSPMNILRVNEDSESQIVGLITFDVSNSSDQFSDACSEVEFTFSYGEENLTRLIVSISRPGNDTDDTADQRASDVAGESLNVGRKVPDVEATAQARFNIIRTFNAALDKALPLVDLTAIDQPGSVAALLSACRGLVFEAIKSRVWDTAINATAGSGGQFELRISRSRARKFINSGQVDHDGRFMVFSQAFRQMHPMSPATLRRSDKLYTAQFMGERAHDAGGPYRESFAMYAQELQSKSLPLMLPTPNGRHAVGYNRDKWVLNPASTSQTHLEMFAFLGKLMGIAIRSKEYLALSIPSIIWKLLVNDAVTIDDLEGIDYSLVKSMNSIRHIDETGMDAETFSMTFFETFTTTSIDDRIVELVPGGASRDVTFENRAEYCDLVFKYRLHEFDAQAAAVRKGLATMVPLAILSLFSWHSLEEMVCGNPEIDVKLLESVTEYSGCSASDAHVRIFWQALGEFNNEERSALIRFCWGRSRLPLNAAAFTQRFKLQSFGHSPADSYLPVAHTCFFSLELPAYSTLTIMKDKLRYAIFNCQAIDGDDTGTGMAVAAMGWEE